jgi:ParB family chromosome partitioning protein
MSEIAPNGRRDITQFNPTLTKERLATASAVAARAARLQDWPQLEAAVDFIIDEQASFVEWWDQTIGVRRGLNRHTLDNADRGSLSVAAVEAEDGIRQQEVSRWRKDIAKPDRYRERLIQAGYRAAHLIPPENHRAEGTGLNEWFTPAMYILAARQVMGGIDLDPATHVEAQKTVQATKFYTAAEDGLAQPWEGRVWLNPPYAQPAIEHFVTKLVEEFGAGRVSQAVLLTHNYTDTRWFHIAAATASMLCFTRGRIAFVDLDGEPCAPTQGQAFFYYGANTDAFHQVFKDFGMVLCRA